MEIILHRANRYEQWEKARRNGWGIEVDLRTHNGQIYLMHDIIHENSLHQAHTLNELFEFTTEFENTIVLDSKETGIVHHITSVPHQRYALTDLIVPDQLFAKAMNIRTLSRRSKYECIHTELTDEHSNEYWVDYVFSVEDLGQYREIAQQSYLVSPELHNLQSKPNNTVPTKHELDSNFIKTVYDLGFKGVCTHNPEMYAILKPSK